MTGSNPSGYAVSGIVYVGIGGASALTEWACFFVLTTAGIHYLTAGLLSFVVATGVNYGLSRTIGFRSRGLPVMREVVLVYAASGVALVANMAVMIMLINTGVGIMAAKVTGTAAAFILNYGIRQFFIFDRRPRWRLPQRTGGSA